LDVVRIPYEQTQLHRSFRSFGPVANQCSTKATEPERWRDFLTTDYWNPPTSESEHARQRILALILAFILVAVLTQAGW
jgi:hypothetical protein